MKKYIPNMLILSMIIGAVYFSDGTYWWSSWAVKWVTLLVIISGAIGWRIAKEFHWSLGIAFFYTMMSSVLLYATRGGYFHEREVAEVLAMKTGLQFTNICFFAVMTFFLVYKDRLKDIGEGFYWIAMANAVYTWIFWGYFKWIPTAMGGIFGNPSMNLCFMAAVTPLVTAKMGNRMLKIGGFWYVLNLLFLLIVAHKVGPILVLTSATVALVLSTYRNIRWRIIGPILLVGFILACLGGVEIESLRNEGLRVWWLEHGSHGRMKVWEWAMAWWWHHGPMVPNHPDAMDLSNASHWFGYGNGTAQILVPRIQQFYRDPNGFFMWFHSEPIQLLFEQGYLGVLAWGTVLIVALKRAFRVPWLFACSVGYVVAMLGNYPLHMAYQAFFGCWLLVSVFNNHDTATTIST